MTNKPLNLGVLGYGHFIRTNFIRRLRECEAVNIVGVFNRGQERRQEALDDGYWATGNLDELLGRPDVEAVLIGTANTVHRDHAIAAARAGKHILCEKPMALNRADITDMVNAADEANVITHVNHSHPYNEAFEKVQELAALHCGKIMQVWVRNSREFGTWKMGARHFAVANPDVSGGWTIHHCCHQVNLASVLVDSKATHVYHTCQKSCDQAPSEELVTSIIHFANGATAQISDGTTIGGFGDLGVIGTDGDIRLSGETITLVTHGETNPEQRPGNLGGISQTFQVPPASKVLGKVGRLFAEAVRTGDASRLLSFQRISHEYDILLAMIESAETGEVVTLSH